MFSLSLTASPTQNRSMYLRGLNGVALTATFSDPSTVNSWALTANSVVIASGGAEVSPLTYTIPTITADTTFELTVVYIDSEDEFQTATATASVTVIDYTPPVINITECFRCDANGNRSASGTKIKATGTIAPTAGFSLTGASVRGYYIDNIEEVNVDYISISSPYTTIDLILDGAYDINKVYEVEVAAYDNYPMSSYIGRPIYKASRVINVKDGGTGIAFGKMAIEDGLVDTSWQFAEGGVPLRNHTRLSGSLETSFTLTVPSGSRHWLVLTAVNAGYQAVYIVTASTNGALNVSKVMQEQGLSYTTGTNALTITKASGVAIRVTDYPISGGAMS